VRWGVLDCVKSDKQRIEYKGKLAFDIVNEKEVILESEKKQTIRKLISNMSSLF